MGVLGTMVVNFTANVQGLQSGTRNAEEIAKDFDEGMLALVSAAIAASGVDTSNIAMVSNGILDMHRRCKRQSKRRMLVAQKRLEQGKDVLKRRMPANSYEHGFWEWFLDAPFDVFIWKYQPFRRYQEIGLIGSLPGNRRIVKPIVVRVRWDFDCWLVSELTLHIHIMGETIAEAISVFRSHISEEIDNLTKRENEAQDQLAYLRDMIEDII